MITTQIQHRETGVGSLFPEIDIVETPRWINTTLLNTTDRLLTCLHIASQVGVVSGVYPFEDGQSQDWSRYYHERYPQWYKPPSSRGVCYDLRANGMDFQLTESMDESLWLSLTGEGLENAPDRQRAFGQALDSLCRAIHVERYSLALRSGMKLKEVYRGVQYGAQDVEIS